MDKEIDKDKVTGGFKYKKGKWRPLWGLLMAPFLLLFWPLTRFARETVNWKAAWATVILFEILMFVVEFISLQRGHWVFNEARIFGPKLFGVPVEEPLLYFFFSPLIIISLYHAVKKRVEKSPKGGVT